MKPGIQVKKTFQKGWGDQSSTAEIKQDEDQELTGLEM